MKETLLKVLAALLLCGIARSVVAGPLLPPLPGPLPASPVAGQTFLPSAGTVTADWIVTFASGQYNYYYYIENFNAPPVTTFQVPTPFGGVTTAGFLTDSVVFAQDFEDQGIGQVVPGYNPTNFPNLGPPPPEAMRLPPGAPYVFPSSVAVTPTDVIWTWSPASPIPPGA